MPNPAAVKLGLAVGSGLGVLLCVGAWLERSEQRQLKNRDVARARDDERHRAPRPEWLRRFERKVIGIKRLGDMKASQLRDARNGNVE